MACRKEKGVETLNDRALATPGRHRAARGAAEDAAEADAADRVYRLAGAGRVAAGAAGVVRGVLKSPRSTRGPSRSRLPARLGRARPYWGDVHSRWRTIGPGRPPRGAAGARTRKRGRATP